MLAAPATGEVEMSTGFDLADEIRARRCYWLQGGVDGDNHNSLLVVP